MLRVHTEDFTSGTTIAPALRLVCYAVYILLISMLILYLCLQYRGEELKKFFRDDRLVENIQLFNIALAAALTLWCAGLLLAWRDHRVWPVLFVAMVFLWGTNREMNHFWVNRDLLPLYKTFQFLFGIGAALIAIVRFPICWREYRKQAWSVPVLLVQCAIGLWIAAELTGSILGKVLPNYINTADARIIKRVVEETIELYASLAALFAAIEQLLAVRSTNTLSRRGTFLDG